MSLRECDVCGDEYDPSKKKRGGYINHCDGCAKEKVERYLGRQGLTNKDASITVLRENLGFWKRTIKRENSIGFNANLPLGSPAFEQVAEGRREENGS